MREPYHKFHLDNWTDADFAKHSAATRATIELTLTQKAEIDRLRAKNKALRDALKPFADLCATRFMTDGIRYDFRVDAAWIRKARAVGGMED